MSVREYELMYILNPDLTPEREAEIHARLDGGIEGGEGIILLRDDWGKRRLAYEIDKLQKGHYFVLNFLGSGAFIVDIERDLRLNPDVLRFLTICVNERVTDIEARKVKAKEQAAEQQRRREEREREAAERAERERRMEQERGEIGSVGFSDDDGRPPRRHDRDRDARGSREDEE